MGIIKKIFGFSKIFFNIFIFRILYILSTLIFLSISSKYLTREDFGLATLILVIINFSVIITNFGFHELTFIKLNKFTTKKRKNKFILETIINKLLLSLFCVLLSVIYFFFLKIYNPIFLIVIIIYLIGNSFLSVSYFVNFEKTKYLMFFQLFSKFILLFILIFILNKNTTLEVLLISFSFAELILGALSLIFMIKNGLRHEKNLNILKNFKSATLYFANTAGSTLYTDLPAFVIASKFSLGDIGNFNLATRIVKSLENLSYPLQNIFFFQFFKISYKKKKFSKFLVCCIVYSIALILLINSFKSEIVTTFFGENQLYAINYIPILSTNILFAMLGATVVHFLIAKKYIKEVVKITWLIGLLSIILIYISTYFSLYFVAFAMVAAQFFILFLLLYKLKERKFF